jgi:signal peptidase I
MPEKESMTSFIKEAAITLALAIIIFVGARATIQTYEVFQTSMLPNFHAGQRVVVLKAVYWFGQPKRGDVIILKAPNGEEKNWIKRVIALPGDTVKIIQGQTYINGIALNEPYVKNAFSYSMAEITVPPDKIFFLGDNRNVSNDSSKGWLLDRENLIGKAWLISWPPSEWSVVPKYDLNQQLETAAGPASLAVLPQ